VECNITAILRKTGSANRSKLIAPTEREPARRPWASKSATRRRKPIGQLHWKTDLPQSGEDISGIPPAGEHVGAGDTAVTTGDHSCAAPLVE
jgi:hypothetical protein